MPKLYAPVVIRFWTLRSYAGTFDNDVQVTRKCRRVRCAGGWKWQLIRYYQDREWDWPIELDKEILDEYGSEMEVLLV